MNGDALTHGLWEATAPAAPATSVLAGNITVDVAIVGAGYTGTSAALHLAEGGANVAVLEAQEIGFGASGRNVGLVNAGMWVMPSVLLERLGDVYGERLLALLGDAPSLVFELIAKHGIDCEAVRSGTLHCAVGGRGASEIEERARQWRGRGAPVEVLDARRTRELTGTGAYAASLLDRRAGTIQPLAYVRGLAAAAMHAGARICTHTPVVQALRSGAKWKLVAPNGASVEADWIIVATDVYARGDGVWPGVEHEQVRLPYFNVATAPLPPQLARAILPQRQGAWDTRRVLSSFRIDASQRLVFGSVGGLGGAGATIHRDWARRALAKLFPQLAHMPFEHAWHGTIGMTADAVPRFHQLDRNVISFSGFNGRGIAPGTVLGRELARLVLGHTRVDALPLPVTQVAAVPWRGLLSLGYEAGARALHLAGARS